MPPPHVRTDLGTRILLVAACLVVIVAGLRASGQLLLPFLVAVFLAIVSLPLMGWLERRRVPRPLAVLITFMCVVAVFAFLVLLLGRSINEFTEAAPRYQARMQELVHAARSWLQTRGLAVPDAWSPELMNPASVMELVTTLLRAIAAVLSNTFLVLLTLVFILFEAAGFPRKLQAALASTPAGLERLAHIVQDVQRYLVLKTLISLATGILVTGWLIIARIDFPLVWGLLAFALNYIPTLGSILAAVPAVLLAAVQYGPGRALVVAVGYVVVNVALANLLEPYLLGRRLGLSTLVVFLSLVFWGWVWGPVGMLLAVPLTVITKIMLEHTDDFKWLAVLLGHGPPGPAK